MLLLEDTTEQFGTWMIELPHAENTHILVRTLVPHSLLLFEIEQVLGQFFKFILSSFWASMELKFRYHPRPRARGHPGQSFAEDRTASWKSYLISNQAIPQVRNYKEKERAIAKEHEPSATEFNQSHIEETHATQELFPADPVHYVKKTIPMGER